VLISSCGFPEIKNFDLLRRHFQVICEHMDWTWAGEILISAASAANAPSLFDKKHEPIKSAGAELVKGTISEETTAAIGREVMTAEDYRRMTTLSFQGGVLANTKVVAIAMKAMHRAPKSE
jgi:hypothetical protein